MSITVQRARTVVRFCTNLALKADHERAVAALDAAQRDSGPAMEASSVTEAARAVRELEEQMRAHTIEFTLEARTRKQWVEFEDTHPPREGNDTDRRLDIDVSSLDKVIAASIVAVTTTGGEPVPFDPAAEWTRLADEMTNGQWEDFALAVLALNRGAKAAPFSKAASSVIRMSERSSN